MGPGLMEKVALHAPFAAWVAPLSEVPDAAFAGGLLGEGLALDPFEGTVRAPCDGEIIAVAPSGHSVTIRHACGAELLIHVGVDTVELKGTGFEARTTVGSIVRTNDVLLSFDLDRVAALAKSVMTPLIVLSDTFTLVDRATDRSVACGEQIASIIAADGSETHRDRQAGIPIERRLTISLANGIHARPAARLAALLSDFVADVDIAKAEQEGNVRSVTALLRLDVRYGDEISLKACGPDAEEALEAVCALIEHGMADEHSGSTAAPRETPAGLETAAAPGVLAAVRAAPGGALGIACHLGSHDLPLPTLVGTEADELAALAAAISSLRDRIGGLLARSDIAQAHMAIVTDPELREAAERKIRLGANAPSAWRAAIRSQADALRATGNRLLAERTADLIDVERQLIAIILGEAEPEIALPDDAIVITDELLPSTFLNFDLERLAGIATAAGGATSHVAILAASRGIPMLVSCGRDVLDIAAGTPMIIDPVLSVLRLDPSAEDRARFRQQAERERAIADEQARTAAENCFTMDGTRIEVFANCGSAGEAEAAVGNGAEGCGLLRTEFLFLDRKTPPSLGEQTDAYAGIARALAGRPLIVRTLDAGSDKPLAYLPMAHEENPALGLRGIRLSLRHPSLLVDQFTAVVQGVPQDQRRIMLPMVADLEELRDARTILRQVEADLGIATPTPLGIMVETPAAALLAEQLAREADFLSIGSNDLTQYALAADRQNAAVVDAAGGLHPAVLRLIHLAATGAHAHGRWLGICGGIASDPDAAAVLIGLGVDELSVTPPMVPMIKARIRGLDIHACRKLAEAALKATSSTEVRLLFQEER